MMIKVTLLQEKNSFYLKIKGKSFIDKKIYSKVETLYSALLSLAEKDEKVISLKHSTQGDIIRLGILGGKHIESAFFMTLEGIRNLQRKYPENIELTERTM